MMEPVTTTRRHVEPVTKPLQHGWTREVVGTDPNVFHDGCDAETSGVAKRSDCAIRKTQDAVQRGSRYYVTSIVPKLYNCLNVKLK